MKPARKEKLSFETMNLNKTEQKTIASMQLAGINIDAESLDTWLKTPRDVETENKLQLVSMLTGKPVLETLTKIEEKITKVATPIEYSYSVTESGKAIAIKSNKHSRAMYLPKDTFLAIANLDPKNLDKTILA